MGARRSGIAVLALWVGLGLAGAADAQMETPDLKAAPANIQVTAVRHCVARAEYRLTYADGNTKAWTEYAVALKIDGTAKGPPPGRAVTLPSGRMGDRILLVFASVDDLKRMVQPGC